MGADGDIDFQARVHVVAENLDNTALGPQLAGGKVGDLGRDDLAGDRLALLPGRNQYLVVDSAVFGDDIADTALLLVAADDIPVRALQHFNDLALLAPAPVDARHPHQHLVAVEDEIHLAGTEVDILLTRRDGDGKTIAVAMPLHLAMQQVHLVHEAVIPAPVDHQLAIALHGAQPLAQGIELLRLRQGQPGGDAVVIERAVRRVEEFQDDFPTGDGVVVAGCLAGSVGVGNLAFLGHSKGGLP